MSNKQHIANIATQIYGEASNANSFLELIKQYREFQNTYNDEMNVSPAFYTIVYRALVESLIMTIARIYDSDSNSITLRSLLTELKDINVSDMDDGVRETYCKLGNKFNILLTQMEERFFKEKVEEVKSIYECLNFEYTGIDEKVPKVCA